MRRNALNYGLAFFWGETQQVSLTKQPPIKPKWQLLRPPAEAQATVASDPFRIEYTAKRVSFQHMQFLNQVIVLSESAMTDQRMLNPEAFAEIHNREEREISNST